jgi:hypothetical protein
VVRGLLRHSQVERSSEFDERPRQTRSGAIKKEPHTQRLSALDSYQTHVTAYVIIVKERGDLAFVVFGVAFQTRDAVFNSTPKTGTDLKAFLGCTLADHGGLLDAEFLRLRFSLSRPQVFPA